MSFCLPAGRPWAGRTMFTRAAASTPWQVKGLIVSLYASQYHSSQSLQSITEIERLRCLNCSSVKCKKNSCVSTNNRVRSSCTWSTNTPHWCLLYAALLVWTWANVTSQRSCSITLKRTFKSCQRWSITCHTYICTVHALDEFPSLCEGETLLQYNAPWLKQKKG